MPIQQKYPQLFNEYKRDKNGHIVNGPAAAGTAPKPLVIKNTIPSLAQLISAALEYHGIPPNASLASSLAMDVEEFLKLSKPTATPATPTPTATVPPAPATAPPASATKGGK